MTDREAPNNAAKAKDRTRPRWSEIWGLASSAAAFMGVAALITLGIVVLTNQHPGKWDYLPSVWNVLLLLFALSVVARRGIRPVMQHGDLNSLWVFVFAFGTALALFWTGTPDQGVALPGGTTPPRAANQGVEALATTAPRLFVVWFLSMLTLVATHVLSRLADLQNLQEETKRVVGDTQKLVSDAGNLVTQLSDNTRSLLGATRELENQIEETTRVAARTIGIENSYASIRALDRIGQLASSSVIDSASRRVPSISRAARHFEDALAVLGAPASTAQGLVFEDIVAPAVLEYMGCDTWDLDPDGELAFVEDGHYITYALLIERLFRHMILTGPRILGDFHRRIEVFTTLNILPRQWYNIVAPTDYTEYIGRLNANSRGLDLGARTTASWEHYRATQAAAVDLGLSGRYMGLTRCILLDGSTDRRYRSLPVSDRMAVVEQKSWILESCCAVRDGLVKTIKARAEEEIGAGRGRPGQLEVGKTELLHSLLNLQVEEWRKILPQSKIPLGIEDTAGMDRVDQKCLAYAVFKQSDNDPQPDGEQWRRLQQDCIDVYHTSPARAMCWHVTQENCAQLPVLMSREDMAADGQDQRPRLPWDLFAVGLAPEVADGDAMKELPRADAIEWLFAVTLDTEERGSTTRTELLRGGGKFGPYTQFIDRLLHAPTGTSGNASLDASVKVGKYE